jgi:hypothetical protein
MVVWGFLACFRYFNSIKFVKDFEKKTLPDFFVNYMTGNMEVLAEQCTEMALRIGLNTAKASQIRLSGIPSVM